MSFNVFRIFSGCIRSDQKELVSAITYANGIILTDAFLDGFCNRSNGPVAKHMPVTVIDLLQVVYVREHDQSTLTMHLAFLNKRNSVVYKTEPVVKARHRIFVIQKTQLLIDHLEP